MVKRDTSERRRGLATVSATVAKIARPLFRRRGFAEGAIITDWAAIVGAHLASIVTPERLAFERDRRDQGTLMIRVASAFGPEVQHLAPQIVERVNVHFGYPAVARLKILPGAIPEPPKRARRRSPASSPSADTLAAIRAVEDPELRAALERLGEALTASAGGPSDAPGAAAPKPPKIRGDK